MFTARYTIDFKMVFGKKRCPRCDSKMNLFFPHIPYTEEERLRLEQRAHRCGEFGGRMHGYTSDSHLLCPRCGLILNSDQYKEVRKIQKERKNNLLSCSELEEIKKK